MLYGVGVATPYLRADLHLTDFQAGLHASAMATGTLTAGLSADRVARRVGSVWLPDVAVAIISTGIALIAFAPGLPASLVGAMLLGLGGGTLGTWVNVGLSRTAGIDSRRLFSQANALAMVMAGAAPVAIGLAASGFHAWRVAFAIPVITFIILAIIRPRESGERNSVRTPQSSLPGQYWFAWLAIALSVSIEFSFVYWGSTIVSKRTGISSADATLMASLFVVGMFLGRGAIGRGFGAGRAPQVMQAAGFIVALTGASLMWASTIPALSAIGLLVGGLGTAGLFPIGLTVALQSAPKAQLQAAARATLASGCAVLLAPSGLGLAADAVGVVAAWTIIPAIAIVGLAVVAVTPRSIS
jgi:MFS family permease